MIDILKEKGAIKISIIDPQIKAESDIDSIDILPKERRIKVNSLSTHEPLYYKFESDDAKGIIDFIKSLDETFDYNFNQKPPRKNKIR